MLNSGVQIAAVPQDDRVQDEAKGAELVFLAFAVGLVNATTPAVADFAGEGVAGFLDGELPVDPAAVGVVDGLAAGPLASPSRPSEAI